MLLSSHRDPDRGQRFVKEIAAIPDLKMDYVILNAGILKYPNVSVSWQGDGGALI